MSPSFRVQNGQEVVSGNVIDQVSGLKGTKRALGSQKFKRQEVFNVRDAPAPIYGTDATPPSVSTYNHSELDSAIWSHFVRGVADENPALIRRRQQLLALEREE